jgi:hypothetical protein
LSGSWLLLHPPLRIGISGSDPEFAILRL